MSQKQGCNFCTRQGLALLPVRPGIRALDDSAPDLPSTVTPPPVTAQGETAYTGRLLREGFLYIWNEMAGSWINYYVTQEGFYYPLPESGDVPPTVVSGKTKPCITEPAELARASLITLPVMPPPYQNGVFWFAWSEVEWTDAVRKQHEDSGYRTRYMQRFDLNGWLTSGKTENVISISGLTDAVAEYSLNADRSDIRFWSPVYWKRVKVLEGTNLIQASEALSPGKGGIIVLDDPVAVLRELSALSNYRLEKNFSQNPTFSRGLVLSSSLSALKDALCTQYERDRLGVADGMEQQTRNGIAVKSGALSPSLAEAQSDLLYQSSNTSLKVQVETYWAQYEKYIDRSKEKAFMDEYNQQLQAYDQQVISPMVAMYLEWVKSDCLLDYMDHNFDPANIRSGALFTQTVMYCVRGMQDKSGAGYYFIEQLSQLSVDARNILLRATVMNQTAWAVQVNSAVAGHGRYDDMPWDKLWDGFKDISEKVLHDVQFSLEGYLNAIGSSLTAMLDNATKSLLPAVVALTATYGKALKTVACTGERKHFISAIVRQLGEMTDLDGRESASRLRHFVDIEVRRLNIAGLSTEGQHQGRYLVLIDAEEVARLGASPEAERAQAAARTLRTADEVSATLFPRWWREPLTMARGGSVGNLANDVRQVLPFTGCAFSAALQVFAVSKATGDLIEGKGRNIEGISKFVANVISAGGALLDAAERAIYKFEIVSLKPLVRMAISESGLVTMARYMKSLIRFCAWFGWVAVGWDLIHAGMAFYTGNTSLGVAYTISAASGGILAVASLSESFSLLLGPVGVAVAIFFVFCSAIYIAMQSRDDIQKWLVACWWRKIPAGENDVPEPWPNGCIEMDKLKDALGQGDS